MDQIKLQPTVSIILPTYNRKTFLPEAIEAIRSQELADWELIVVDDGSTDGTSEVIDGMVAAIPQTVKYISQENQGAYGARNTGLDHAAGRFIAFYDSDDIWLVHHLRDCVEALENNEDVDWVYGACQMVDHETEEELVESTFYDNGEPRPFLKVPVEEVGSLRIISNKVLRHKVLFRVAPYCGLQNSVLRKSCFDGVRFETKHRNEAEDSLFAVRHILGGGSLAYLDNVHVIYRVHNANSSAAGDADFQRQFRVLTASINALEEFGQSTRLGFMGRIAFQRMLAQICFWNLGYSTLWKSDERIAALRTFRRGIRHWPFCAAFYKTYAVSLVRSFARANNNLVPSDSP